MLRFTICRNAPVVAVVIVLNVATALLFFSPVLQEKFCTVSTDTKTSRLRAKLPSMPPATVTVTAVTTTTAVVERVVDRPTLQSKPPGPAFCDVCGPEDPLCNYYGEHNLARSRGFEGANARFRRVISDALAGKPTKIGILGGSVSKGHGLRSRNDNWIYKFVDAWRMLFPKSETTFINGAVPATGSDYFSMCFREHIDEDVDLVVLELLINDERLESNAVAYEWLLRGLLQLPKNPAVLNLHTIGLSFSTITTGGDLHTAISEYYDVPVISMRNVIAPHIMKHPDLDQIYFYREESGNIDWRHVSTEGHKVMADLLAAYTQRQICAVAREKAKPSQFLANDKVHGIEELDTVPRLRLFQKYDRETVTGPIKATCQTITATKHPLSPIETHGWQRWMHPKQKDKPYLVAREPGARVKFNVFVGVVGRVRITYLRSKTFGLGDVWCWLDNDRHAGRRVSSWWNVDNINVAQVYVIADNAKPGDHVLTCEVMEETADPGKGHEFRLIAVDAA